MGTATHRARSDNQAGVSLFRGFGKLTDLAALVVDQQKQVEITNGRRAATALNDDRLPPFFIMRALSRFNRWPDIDASDVAIFVIAGNLDCEVLAYQFLVRLPFRNHLASAPASCSRV